jgi:hypothetical protein
MKDETINERVGYTVDFPNTEVREAFLESLLETSTNRQRAEREERNNTINKVFNEKDGEGVQRVFTELFAFISSQRRRSVSSANCG